MFDNVNEPKSAAVKINPIDQIKRLVEGGENMEIETKIMKGSKGSGNAYLIGNIKGVEVFRLECGNVKDWTSVEDLNLYVFALMEQITAGFVSYVEENKARAEKIKAEERSKRASHVDAIKVELGNVKTPAEFRKVLRNHGLHPDSMDRVANKVEALAHAVEDVFAEYIGGDI